MSIQWGIVVEPKEHNRWIYWLTSDTCYALRDFIDCIDNGTQRDIRRWNRVEDNQESNLIRTYSASRKELSLRPYWLDGLEDTSRDPANLSVEQSVWSTYVKARTKEDCTSSDPAHNFFGWNIPCKGLGCCTIDDDQPTSQNFTTQGVANSVLCLDLFSWRWGPFHWRVDALYQECVRHRVYYLQGSLAVRHDRDVNWTSNKLVRSARLKDLWGFQACKVARALAPDSEWKIGQN
jgi:hypothetical protein